MTHTTTMAAPRATGAAGGIAVPIVERSEP